jgi:hypothetical protein
MDGIHHHLQGRIKNRARFFGIKAFDQCRGTFEVGKQRRDRLTLAIGDTSGFQCCLFSTNALGEMSRRPLSWGWELDA